MFEKRLTSREREVPEAVAAFEKERKLLATLGGRATPLLLASGVDGRGPWLRTEALPFPTLAERLRTHPANIDSTWIERAVRSSFEALASLHEARIDDHGPPGVVHGDVSPENVAFDDDANRAAFLDFELARFYASPPSDGAFRGTVRYVAPEIARGGAPTVQSDLFALAATLLHAARGSAPRMGPSLATLLAMAAEVPILNDASRLELRARGPGHAQIVACLSHAPDARPSSARAVVLALG